MVEAGTWGEAYRFIALKITAVRYNPTRKAPNSGEGAVSQKVSRRGKKRTPLIRRKKGEPPTNKTKKKKNKKTPHTGSSQLGRRQESCFTGNAYRRVYPDGRGRRETGGYSRTGSVSVANEWPVDVGQGRNGSGDDNSPGWGGQVNLDFKGVVPPLGYNESRVSVPAKEGFTSRDPNRGRLFKQRWRKKQIFTRSRGPGKKRGGDWSLESGAACQTIQIHQRQPKGDVPTPTTGRWKVTGRRSARYTEQSGGALGGSKLKRNGKHERQKKKKKIPEGTNLVGDSDMLPG